MKILHIITGLGLGGAETVLFRLVSNTNDKDSTSVITLGQGGVYADRIKELGVDVYSLNMPKGRPSISGLLNLYRYIKSFSPDVIQTWMYHADLIGGIIGRLAGAKTIIWGIRNSNLDPTAIGNNTRRVAKLCALLSPWIPSSIISCSQTAVGSHVRMGYAANKFMVIPNGYDHNYFIPNPDAGAKLRKELGVPNDISVLGMVARFDPQKDHSNLISALALLKKKNSSFACLLVGGDMEDNNSVLRQLLNNADINDSVQLLGPRSDIVAVMNALDINILSSLGEGFPNVIAEAMACGTPCVATDVGDARLIIEDEGWVVPPQDSNALATAIEAAILEKDSDTNAWARRKEMCRSKIVNNYSIDSMAKSYRETWANNTATSNNEEIG
jgi:glycosyltransferase involved in cell wall biosynthesis